MQHSQVFCQPFWHTWFVGVNALDFSRLQDQLRRLLAMAIVIAHNNVVDDFRQRALRQSFSIGCSASFASSASMTSTSSSLRAAALPASAYRHSSNPYHIYETEPKREE